MEIWQEIRKNGEIGARRLVSEYGNRLFGAALLLCSDDHDAEELVFRTFAQAVKKIKQYQPRGDFFAWLYAIMLNFRRMDIRKQHLDLIPVGDPRDIPESAPSGVADVRRAFTSEDVRLALRMISPVLREVILLRYFENKTQTEVAEILGISQVQVSRLEKRILRRLKELA